MTIESHPVYQDYRQKYAALQHDTKHFITTNEIAVNLTEIVLAGQDKISFRDTLYFIDTKYHSYPADIEADEPSNNYSLTFLTLGSMLSGHSGIVHGGLLATLLDELTCRLAFQNFESKRGVTASLTVSYKKPTFTDGNVVIRCEVIKKLGRKCWVRGSVYELKDDDFENNLLVESEVLVIEPRWVEKLNTPAAGSIASSTTSKVALPA